MLIRKEEEEKEEEKEKKEDMNISRGRTSSGMFNLLLRGNIQEWSNAWLS